MNETDILQVIEQTKELSGKDRKNALIKIADKSSISRIFLHLALPKSDNRALLRALCDICSTAKTADIVKRNTIIYNDKIKNLLNCNDAKTRKIVSELIGKSDVDLFYTDLVSAINTETTDFVRPSMILALGNSTSHKTQALDYLKSYKPVSSDIKHLDNETTALKKAISSLSGEHTIPAILTLPKGTVLSLDCPSTQVTLKELRSIGYEAKVARFPYNTVHVYGVERYRRIFAARSFYTASILYGQSYRNFDEITRIICSREFSEYLHKLFGNNELYFRLELKCEKGYEPENGRNKTAEDIAKLIDKNGDRLKMSPSSYGFEIVINITAKGICLCILPSRKLDDRFTYKKESVPASIHPAAAAACVSFIKDHIYKDSDVLDCFCGSGTMLFERSKLPYKSLTGSDISPDAVKASRTNERIAKTGAKFFAKNATSEFREQYDEVICNMPFGLRVGSHDKNRALYQAFLQNLKNILSKRGRAFLFTNDKKLLSELISDNFELLGKHNFSCGGLYPTLFILKNK